MHLLRNFFNFGENGKSYWIMLDLVEHCSGGKIERQTSKGILFVHNLIDSLLHQQIFNNFRSLVSHCIVERLIKAMIDCLMISSTVDCDFFELKEYLNFFFQFLVEFVYAFKRILTFSKCPKKEESWSAVWPCFVFKFKILGVDTSFSNLLRVAGKFNTDAKCSKLNPYLSVTAKHLIWS